MSEATAGADTEVTMRPKEGAKILRVSEGKFYEGLNRGQIPGFKIGDRWIISRVAFMRWLEREAQAF